MCRPFAAISAVLHILFLFCLKQPLAERVDKEFTTVDKNKLL